MRPPAIIELSQYGVQRGKTTTITVDGQNLIEADAVLFDDARISGKIVSRRDKGRIEIRRVEGSTAALINDIANNTELIVEMTVPDSVEPGTHGFRVRTPLGTTALRTFAVGLLPELDETEMNDTPDGAQTMTLPMTVNGALQRGGDVDHFWFEAKAGQQIVFAMIGTPIGSRVDSTVTILDASGATVASNDDGTWQMRDSLLVHTFAKDGRYARARRRCAGCGRAARFPLSADRGRAALRHQRLPARRRARQRDAFCGRRRASRRRDVTQRRGDADDVRAARPIRVSAREGCPSRSARSRCT